MAFRPVYIFKRRVPYVDDVLWRALGCIYKLLIYSWMWFIYLRAFGGEYAVKKSKAIVS
jgi:hypothetical protein